MVDDERLREALIELELLRDREARSHRETTALLRGLGSIHSDLGPAESIRALLQVVSETLNCDRAVVFQSSESGSRITLANGGELEGLAFGDLGVPMTRSRRLVDIRALVRDEADLPEPLRGYHSLLAEPIRSVAGEIEVLGCLSTEKGLFSKHDSKLLKRFCNIAAQALAGLELEERNAFLAAVIEESSSSVSIGEIVDGRLSLTYVNKAFEALNGYTQAEAMGRDDSVFWVGEPERLSDFRACLANREAGTFRLPNCRKDGSDFVNEVTVSPIVPEGRPISHVVLTQTDVTKQVKAEADRDEARKRLESALSSTGEGFLAIDRDGTILFANAQFEEFVSMYQVEWGVGWQFTDIWSRYLMGNGVPRDVALVKAEEYLERLLTKARTLEVRLPDGRVVLVNERPIEDGGAVIVASNVTALKSAEQSLLQRAAAIENVQDGIAITDLEGRLTYANPRLLDLWEIEVEDDLLGRNWDEFYEPSDVATLRRRLARLNEDDQPSARAELRRTGRTEQVHLLSLTLVADLGKVVTVHDISERLREERSRAVLRERLQSAQRQEALGQMAAGLAHDFNNLLSVITGSANLIAEGAEVSETDKKAAERIVAAGYRAAEIVNRLLDLGASEQEKEELDLQDVLREAVDFSRASIRPGAHLIPDLGDTPLPIHASRTDILQMALNLIINAHDALPPSGGEIRLVLETGPEFPAEDIPNLGRIDPRESYARITVADTGSGISADAIDKIFDAYFTTKGDTGTGLGLAVVASVIKANDAALFVRSALGKGTTFDIYWPLGRKPDESRQRNRLVDGEADLTGQPIILVDDEPEAIQYVAQFLEQAGAEVVLLDAPDLALEAIRDDPESWACLVTDYNMPGMNGGELIEKVRKISPTIPIVVVTALARRLQDPRISSNNVDAVLAKPVEPKRLLSEVRSALERRRQEVE